MKKMRQIRGVVSILLTIFMGPLTSAQSESSMSNSPGNLGGRLFEKGTRKPLREVSIFLLPHKLKAVTESNGYFKFLQVPFGEYEIIVNQAGYQKLEKGGVLTVENPSQSQTLFLEKSSYNTFETTIVGAKSRRDDSQKSLKQEEFLSLPGAGGDPVKAVQNLPGINRVSGFSSQVVIQGSAPKDTTYAADGHRIPLVFHFGGLSSVIMPEALETVDYLSAGYGSEYSRALGGVISLQTRKPDIKERESKGFFFVDTLKAGGLFESKIDEKSSFLVSGRYSYIGLFLAKATEKNSDLNLTVAPEFSDFTGIYHRELNPGENLKIVTVASHDTLGFLFKQPAKSDPTLRGNFRNETTFYRLIPQWSRQIDDTQAVKLSFGLGRDQISVDVGQNYFYLISDTLTTRGEWEKKWSELWITHLGFDNSYGRAAVKIRLPAPQSEGGVSNPLASSEVRETTISGKINNVGIYFRNELKHEKLTTLPALRVDSFSQTKEVLLSPRLGFRYLVSESLSFRTAGGLYYQPPEPQESDATYGNPGIKAPRAVHFMLGFEKDLKEGRTDGLSLSGGFFDRWFNKLVVPSQARVERDGVQVNENVSNSGGGRAYGLETQLKFENVPFTGWIAYTWSKSTRWRPNTPEYNYEYDQTHNLNLVMARDFSNNWKVSGRFRFVTGNPWTPISGATFDADNDVYIPSRGGIYSERQGDFSQLDLRFDKKYILDQAIWSVYLDIQNVLGQKNTESYQYSYNYKEKEAISGLPLLPSLGVKGEF
ncbi:MAG: carboxypeptidase-like regulatory domain-containing protein [Bdellovibrionaceae bacterium]|nr:carboxypeptidase-like regulatory domain-containing protein [Pseudobdellovibrionaceae bacterium]